MSDLNVLMEISRRRSEGMKLGVHSFANLMAVKEANQRQGSDHASSKNLSRRSSAMSAASGRSSSRLSGLSPDGSPRNFQRRSMRKSYLEEKDSSRNLCGHPKGWQWVSHRQNSGALKTDLSRIARVRQQFRKSATATRVVTARHARVLPSEAIQSQLKSVRPVGYAVSVIVGGSMSSEAAADTTPTEASTSDGVAAESVSETPTKAIRGHAVRTMVVEEEEEPST